MQRPRDYESALSHTSDIYSKRIDRYREQRKEFTHNLQITITPVIEEYMRRMHQAALLCAYTQPVQWTEETAFEQMIAQSRKWADSEIINDLGEKRAQDADLALQMVVKSHATVLALSTGKHCRGSITCPNIIKFFRMVLDACVSELSDSGLFKTTDIDTRAKVRAWIDQIIQTQAYAIVPVGIFVRSTASAATAVTNPVFEAVQYAVESAQQPPPPTIGSPLSSAISPSMPSVAEPPKQVEAPKEAEEADQSEPEVEIADDDLPSDLEGMETDTEEDAEKTKAPVSKPLTKMADIAREAEREMVEEERSGRGIHSKLTKISTMKLAPSDDEGEDV
jgi:hypothetical protein